MIFATVKFIHVILVMSLLGLSVFSLINLKSKEIFSANQVKLFILLCLGAALTGTLLIYPSHFTFYTPWIEAAYLLLLVYLFCLLIIPRMRIMSPKLSKLIMVISIFILLIIIHDAITQSTYILTGRR